VALEKTRRVSRIARCPICNHADWCLVARSYAICMRIESDRPSRSGLGGWIHRLKGSLQSADWTPGPVFRPTSNPTTIAPLEQRDMAYRSLQTATTLSEKHRLALLNRGYSQEEIASRGYRTLPFENRWKLARQCCNGNATDLAHVPGFFVGTSRTGHSYWSIAGSPGLLIPCRSPDGRIRAFRIRPDDPRGDGGKYRWFSSGNKHSGTGSGVHCHVAWPLSGELRDRAIWISEGEIKADLSAERLGAVVLSIPGVGNWARALADLCELLPGGGRVVVALDSDWQSKAAVHQAIWCLRQACSAFGYGVQVALWNTTHKGLDDLLTAGLSPELHPLNDLPEPTWPLKVSSRILGDVPVREPPAAVELATMRTRITDLLAGAYLSW
jgi:hypothetical protein